MPSWTLDDIDEDLMMWTHVCLNWEKMHDHPKERDGEQQS